MRNIVLDMQSGLYAQAVKRILMQELDDYQVIVSPRPEDTAEQCRMLRPYALLMEVTGYTPWKPDERLAIVEQVAKTCPDCRTLFIADDAAGPEVLGPVKQAKREGTIDAFLFTSVTESYLVAVIDSL